MSGGHFSYLDSRLKNEIFGWDEISNQFEDMEISELVFDVLDLIHAYDWYRCGDTGEDTWLKKKKKFKQKWFETPRTERIKAIVDKALEETKKELYKTFELGDV